MANSPRPRGGTQTSDRRRLVREQQNLAAAAAKRRRTLIQIAIVAGVAVVVIGIVASAVLLGRQGQSKDGATPTASGSVTLAGASVPFAVDGSAVRLGPADAPARVDLWVDYSCPHCQEFEAENNAALSQLVAGGGVSVSYHNIQIVTDYGTEAGSAAACVAAHDPQLWAAFNSALYANHSAQTDGWTASQFRTFAQQQGAGEETLSCIGAAPYKGWIAKNTADSASQGVTGTPTLFFNGEKSETISGQALIDKVKQLAGR